MNHFIKLDIGTNNESLEKIESNTNETKLRNIIGGHKILFIDEAQRIENIGLTLKIIVDQIKDIEGRIVSYRRINNQYKVDHEQGHPIIFRDGKTTTIRHSTNYKGKKEKNSSNNKVEKKIIINPQFDLKDSDEKLKTKSITLNETCKLWIRTNMPL